MAVFYGRGRRTCSRLPARSVLLNTSVQRSPPETRTPRYASHALVQAYLVNVAKKDRNCGLFLWQGQKDLFSPAGSVGASEHKCSEVSTGDPHPSIRFACLGSSIFSQCRKKRPQLRSFFMAGAEGLEPSARGFGDRCSTN